MSQFEDDREQLFWEEWFVQFEKVDQLMKDLECLETERKAKKLYQHPRNRLARLLKKIVERLEMKLES